jgi:hypothetical protein
VHSLYQPLVQVLYEITERGLASRPAELRSHDRPRADRARGARPDAEHRSVAGRRSRRRPPPRLTAPSQNDEFRSNPDFTEIRFTRRPRRTYDGARR